MKVDDLNSWNMKPEPTEGCEVKCPECGEWANHSEWAESEVGCEDCGSHMAIRCPNCGEDFDSVHSVEFSVRNTH